MIGFALIVLVIILYITKHMYDADSERSKQDWRYETPSKFRYYRNGTIWGIAIGVVLWFAASLIYTEVAYEDAEPTECWRFPIVASADTTLTSGRWGIFGGYVNEMPVYFYYREYSDGAVRQGNIPAKGTPIYQDEETSPHIRVLKTRCDPSIGVDNDGSEWFWGFADMRGGFDRSYEIHVPADSVVEHHTYDLGRN